jgi:hypothetical protein
LEVRIIMACAIYHVRGSVQPARGATERATRASRSTEVATTAARYWPT